MEARQSPDVSPRGAGEELIRSPRVRLVEIERDGAPGEPVGDLPEVAQNACASTAALYERVGFSPPWIGYLALCDSEVVGTCAFPAAPRAGRVEIAYFTFPSFEGRGIATAMAGALIALARTAQPAIEIFAHTRAEPNASNRVLQNLGFTLAGTLDHPEEGAVWEWRLTSRA